MKITLATSWLTLAAGTLAALFEPPVSIAPSAWAAEHVVLPDGEYAGQKIDLTRTPHIVEPLNLLGPDSPCNEIAIRKSGQTAFTTMLLCSVAYSIDRDPCDMAMVLPTEAALTKFNSMKLSRMIELTEPLGGRNGRGGKVYPHTSRSARASTTNEKKFSRGSLNLLLASSPSQLRMLTLRKVFCDEVDEYEDDLEGQGDPLTLIARAQKSFIASGMWKRAYISTPTVEGASKIDQKFQAGDQRQWHVACPHCQTRIVLGWHAPYDPATWGFKFSKTYPHKAHYVAQCCGGIIESWQKRSVYLTGEWRPTAPGPGKFPSYHFDEISAPFSSWDQIAKDFVDAADDPTKLKAFWNLSLGLPFDISGDAPDHELLMQRREDYRQGHIPPGALLLSAFVDVQMRGLYVEVVAWAPDQQSWTIFADYLDGETTEVDAGAFAELTKLYLREWPDAFGNKWRLDEIGIDSGYRTDVVYEWSRRHPGAKATKGVDGWAKVPLGVASDQDVDYRGRKMRSGAKLRLMGTWPLKSKFYTYAALTPIVQGSALTYPPGYCHFGNFLDENYFKQITSEFLDEERFRGRVRKVWKVRAHRDNHFLDCRIGNLALVNAYFASFTADDWAHRAKDRGVPADLQAPDLFTPKEFQATADRSAPAQQAPAAETETTNQKGDEMDAYFERLAALNGGAPPAAPKKTEDRGFHGLYGDSLSRLNQGT
jgi:phage terminase large subunit GpA-like protein